jgi:Amt family ammonium transporter
MTKKIVLLVVMVFCLAGAGMVHGQTTAGVALTDADLKSAVKPTDRANGDPDGSLTGTANDIAISDPKVGITVTDVLNQIGANRIGSISPGRCSAAF